MRSPQSQPQPATIPKPTIEKQQSAPMNAIDDNSTSIYDTDASVMSPSAVKVSLVVASPDAFTYEAKIEKPEQKLDAPKDVPEQEKMSAEEVRVLELLDVTQNMGVTVSPDDVFNALKATNNARNSVVIDYLMSGLNSKRPSKIEPVPKIEPAPPSAVAAFCYEPNPEIQLNIDASSKQSDQEAADFSYASKVAQQEINVAQQQFNAASQPKEMREQKEAPPSLSPKLSLANVVAKNIKILSPTARRATIMKQQWIAKKQFVGSGLPLIVCIRCNNHFFVEKVDEIFTATARQRNLKYAFTLIPISPYAMDEDIYQIVHIESARYLSVKRIGKYWTLYPVENEDMQKVDRKDLSFCIVKISGDEEVNLRVTVAWHDKFLTIKDSDVTAASSPNKMDSPNNRMQRISEGNSVQQRMAQMSEPNFDFEDDFKGDGVGDSQGSAPSMDSRALSLLALDGKDKMLIFDEPYMEHIDHQVFTLERVVEDEEDDDLDVLFLLDLVNIPRPEKIGMPKTRTYEHIPLYLVELINAIYVRIDVNKTGYAPYVHVWQQFVQYSLGQVPRIVIEAFEEGVMAKVKGDELQRKLIHIKNFITAIDTIIEFHVNEIKMEQLNIQKERELRSADPIDMKLRRLDSDILSEHPFLAEWQEMSGFARWAYDWRLWLSDRWHSDSGSAGLFLWRKHLVKIQGNFGESIFLFFQFTRWLMLLNLGISIIYGFLIFCHIANFDFGAHSASIYPDMLLGSEYTSSWWFYGAYLPRYADSQMASVNIGFVWIMIGLGAVVVSVVAVLRVLLNVGMSENDEADYAFSKDVLANYNHSLRHSDAVTLQTNSIMIGLHETLLAKLDEEAASLTCVLVLKRMLGVAICVVVGVLSAIGITALIVFEDNINSKAKDVHSSMERFSMFIVPAGVAVIKGITPHIVRAVVVFEDYSAEFLFQQTFFRVFLLRIFAILVTLFQTAKTAEEAEDAEVVLTLAENPNLEQVSVALCAESQIG